MLNITYILQLRIVDNGVDTDGYESWEDNEEKHKELGSRKNAQINCISIKIKLFWRWICTNHNDTMKYRGSILKDH